MAANSTRTFRVFLLRIAAEITKDALDSLKFLCEDDLPKGELESVKTPREFLELLWKGGKICLGNVSYLADLLENADNIQLANKVKEQEPRATNLPCQTKNFLGRDAVVNEIKGKLVSGSSHMAIVIALPGMGKTEVAIRVGHLLQSDNWPVLFIEKQKNLLELCEEILYHLTNRRWTTSDNIVLHARRKLSELKDNTVIILDDTVSVQGPVFDNFVQFLVSAPKVRVIITTQEDIGFVSVGNIHKIRLDPLDHASSAELLTQLAPNSKNYANELAELCGGIPLFLNYASALMIDGFCPKVFTEELRKNPSKVLKGTELLDTFYQSMGRFLLGKFSEEVLKNLVRLSVFPSSFSTDDILFLFDDEYQLQTVKTKLIQRGLLQMVNDELLTIHPLVQTYCREERDSLNLVDVGQATEHQFNHHYLELLRGLHKSFITKDSSSNAIRRFRKDKANIMEAFNNCLKDTSEAEEKVFAIDVANEVVDFLAKIFSPPVECTKLYQQCCKIARQSADQKRLADSLNSSAFRRLEDLAHRKGDDATLEMFQEACDIGKRLPEEEQKNEKRAHSITKLGLCILLQGDAERGRQLIHEGIALRKELGVPLYVAAGNCDLGNSYRHCKQYDKAVKIWETETLPIYKEKLGEHPWTASILHHIAFAFRELAREDPTTYADQAEKYTKEALHLRERLLEVHQDTGRSHYHLSLVYIMQEKLDSALTELEKALGIQEDVVGVQQDTVDTLKMMADVLNRLGRREEAEKMTAREMYYRRNLEDSSGQ